MHVELPLGLELRLVLPESVCFRSVCLIFQYPSLVDIFCCLPSLRLFGLRTTSKGPARKTIAALGVTPITACLPQGRSGYIVCGRRIDAHSVSESQRALILFFVFILRGYAILLLLFSRLYFGRSSRALTSSFSFWVIIYCLNFTYLFYAPIEGF